MAPSRSARSGPTKGHPGRRQGPDVTDFRTRVHSAPECVNIMSFTFGRCA